MELTDLSVISFHNSPHFFPNSLMLMPGNLAFIDSLLSFIQMK